MQIGLSLAACNWYLSISFNSSHSSHFALEKQKSYTPNISNTANKTPKTARKKVNGRIDFDTAALQGKLWKEVELTIQTAQMLSDCELKVKVHVDYNSDEKAGSHILYASGIGYAQGMGFEAEGKPHAWAATHVADSLCR